jgi:hypothetical protein
MTRWADEVHARLSASVDWWSRMLPADRQYLDAEREREQARQSQQARIRRRLERVL